MNDSQTDIPINVLHAHLVSPANLGTGTPVTMKVLGPGMVAKNGITNNVGFVADPGGSGVYSCSFIPDEAGVWSLILLDVNGVVLHSSTFRAVRARIEDYSLRLTNAYSGMIAIYPTFFTAQKYAINITSLTQVGGVATAVTASAHGLSVSSTVSLYGCVATNSGQTNILNQGYHGNFVVQSIVSPTSFTFNVPAALASPAQAAAGSAMQMYRPATTSSTLSNATMTYAAFVSAGKFVVPQSRTIVGIQVQVAAGVTGMTYARFFTCSSDGNYIVRGVSEDWHAATPIEGAFNGSFRTVYFRNPVPARVGDWWGIEIAAPAGQTSTTHLARAAVMNSVAATQQIMYRASNASGINTTGGVNTFGAFGGGVYDILQVKLLMRPPAVVLAGHSYFTGSADQEQGTNSTFDYNTGNMLLSNTPGVISNTPFNASLDMGAFLEAQLGVPVINCAVGGSSILGWIGQPVLYGGNDNVGGGWFEQLVAPLHPAAMLYDTVYNDALAAYNANPQWTATQYLGYLDALLWHCAQYQIELIMMDATPALSATVSPRWPFLQLFRKLVREWCHANSVVWIPTMYQMGQNSGATSNAYGNVLASDRDEKKQADPRYFLPNYEQGSSVATTTHLTYAGRVAMANYVAQAIRTRVKPWPLYPGLGANELSIVPPGSRSAGGTGISGGG